MLLVNNESILVNLVLVDCAKTCACNDFTVASEPKVQNLEKTNQEPKEAKRSRHGEPGDVAVNCRGTAGKERPQADARIDAEVEEMLDGTPRKKSRTARDDVKMEGNKNKRINSRNFCGGTTQREETRLAGTLSYMSLEAFIVNKMDADENIMCCFNKWKDRLYVTVCEEFSCDPDQSPDSFVTALITKTSPEAFTQLPQMGARERRRKVKKRLDWWMSLDEEKNVKEPKRRSAREWWKEEYCDKFVRKRKKNKKKQGRESSTHNLNNNNWWQKDDEMSFDNRKKKRSRSTSRGSRGSIDWWLDGFSAMTQQPRIPSSGLMTGNDVLIRAKEYEQNQAIAMISYYASSSEPAQVRGKTVYLRYSNRQEIVNNKTSANVAWNVLLVTIEGNDARSVSIDVLHLDLDKEQALVCITVALLCLKKHALQPSMKEIVALLSGPIGKHAGPIYAEQQLIAFQMLGQMGLAVKIAKYGIDEMCTHQWNSTEPVGIPEAATK
ncbi:hypothetical protein Tco_0188729 [Tanacetum coccineum]